MDAEDLGHFGIAPQGLKTSAQFSKVKPAAEEARKRKREEFSEASAIPGDPVELDELFRPVTETVGVNLLKGMGWRQGQGVGPRLSARQKARQAAANQRMFGCPLPASQQDKAESDEDDGDIDPKYRVRAVLHQQCDTAGLSIVWFDFVLIVPLSACACGNLQN